MNNYKIYRREINFVTQYIFIPLDISIEKNAVGNCLIDTKYFFDSNANFKALNFKEVTDKDGDYLREIITLLFYGRMYQ